jgi:hypothetical protein
MGEGRFLSLVGCSERDLADVPERLRSSGLNIRPFGAVSDGDSVVFCISCVDGPTDGTLQSLAWCAGRTIVSVAIVLTRAELVDDDSIRELVTVEEMELLSRIIPYQEVERLLLLYDFDPGLVDKIRSRMSEESRAVSCSVG